MSTFLLTGGAGFIGSHTAALLRERGHLVRVLDDLSSGRVANLEGLDVELVEGCITDAGLVGQLARDCDFVIHLAARPSVPGSCEDPVTYDRINVHGTVTVLEAARQAGVRQVALASSSAVYGSSPEVPKREDMPLSAESPYAAAKAANELYAQTYSRTLGLPVVALRYFNVFGPRQDPDGPYAAVIPKFVERALAGKPLLVFGDGSQSRDFVSVADVARANLLAATTSGLGGRVFNIGTGSATTIAQLATWVRQHVAETGIEYRAARAGDVAVSVAEVSTAARDLGWAASADFEAAMAATIASYSATQPGR